MVLKFNWVRLNERKKLTNLVTAMPRCVVLNLFAVLYIFVAKLIYTKILQLLQMILHYWSTKGY